MKKYYLALTVALLATVAVAQHKPYITRIYDFRPAPGQFVNELPEWEPGDTHETMLERVAEAICGYDRTLTDGTTRPVVADGMVSLGAFGGYVVFGFDHPVVNVPGELDLQIFGNAFQSDESSLSGGSCEPGIVMVSTDVNGNGIPDDAWYELAGSDHNAAGTQRGYTITYYRPDPDKTPVASSNYRFVTDAEYIRWTANDALNPDSVAGYMTKISFHTQSYWPEWIEGDQLTFTGTKLACNAIALNDKGTNWLQLFLDWGYVDNRSDFPYQGGEPQEKQNKGFDLGWAIDDDGNPVKLASIDFVKVYTAMNQWCGWVGETSTEVAGAIDLHPDAEVPEPQGIVGDVNGDGEVTATDVAMIVNILAGLEPRIDAADVNGDNEVSATDIAMVVNILAGLQDNE